MSRIKLEGLRGDDPFRFRAVCGLVQLLSERDDAWADVLLGWEGYAAVLEIPGSEEDLVEVVATAYATRIEDPRWTWTTQKGAGLLSEYRDALRRFADHPGALAWVRGTGTDQVFKPEKGDEGGQSRISGNSNVEGTAFDTMAGKSGGLSVFVQTPKCLEHLAELDLATRADAVRDAFHDGVVTMPPPFHPLFWDANRYRETARTGRNEQNDPKTIQPVLMALAIESLALYPVNARGTQRQTAGFTPGESAFSWGLWRNPVNRDALKRILDHPSLHSEEPVLDHLRAVGFTRAFRSLRDKDGQFRFMFRPAQTIFASDL